MIEDRPHNLIGYAIVRPADGGGIQFLTPDGGWAYGRGGRESGWIAPTAARVFEPDDFCNGFEDKGTKREGRLRAQVECDLHSGSFLFAVMGA